MEKPMHEVSSEKDLIDNGYEIIATHEYRVYQLDDHVCTVDSKTGKIISQQRPACLYHRFKKYCGGLE